MITAQCPKSKGNLQSLNHKEHAFTPVPACDLAAVRRLVQRLSFLQGDCWGNVSARPNPLHLPQYKENHPEVRYPADAISACYPIIVLSFLWHFFFLFDILKGANNDRAAQVAEGTQHAFAPLRNS